MGESQHIVNLKVNGISHQMAVEPYETLVHVLRERLGLTGTKVNCARGECGACTVLLDGKAVNSCLVLAATADGHEILTIEGLAVDGCLDALQRSFIELDATHCGFCTPGMIMAAKGLLLANPNPSVEEIQVALAGNLCRCTGYRSIIDAVGHAARAGGPDACCREEPRKP